MELFQIVLIIHILSGYSSLTLGTLVLAGKKGTRRHKKLGIWYFNLMVIMSLSAFYLAWNRDIDFLLLVNVFVFYLTISGRNEVKQVPRILMIVVTLLASINSYIMFSTFNPILIVFAVISTWLILNDIYALIQEARGRKLGRLFQLRQHIGKITGSYIGAFTAFLVVNVKNLEPAWLVWLGPTILFGPLIAYWIYKYIKPKKAY